jgi:hypothetical protein
MHVPHAVEYALEHFIAGSNSIWTHDVTYYFTPSSKKYEHKRMAPCELSLRAKHFLLCEPDDDVDTIPDTEIMEGAETKENTETKEIVAGPAGTLHLASILGHAKHI